MKLPRRIIAVSEYFKSGGLESQILAQRRYLASQGVALHLATWSPPEPQHKEFGSDCLHLHAEQPLWTAGAVVKSAHRLASYINENEIDHVHAHPFHSILPAVAAAGLAKKTVSITLHGPTSAQPADWCGLSYRWLLGRAVYSSVGNVFAVSPEVAAMAAPHLPLERIKILPNGVDGDTIKRVLPNFDSRRKWVVVSRLDKDKTPGVKKFIALALKSGVKRIKVLGDGECMQEVKSFVECPEFLSSVELCGMVSRPWEHFDSDCSGVAGMGRAILEAAAAGMPCCLVGYNDVHGLMTPKEMRLAANTNFSGRGMPVVSEDVFSSQLTSCTTDVRPFDLSQFVRSEFGDAAIWSDYLKTISVDSEIKGLPAAFVDWMGTLPVWTDVLNDVRFMQLADMVLENNGISSKLSSERLLLLDSFSAQLLPISAQIAETRAALTSRDDEISNVKADLARTAAEFSAIQQMLSLRDSELATARDVILQRDAERTALYDKIAAEHESLMQRSAQLKIVQEALLARDSEFAELRCALSQRDEQIARYHRMTKDSFITAYRKLRRAFGCWPY